MYGAGATPKMLLLQQQQQQQPSSSPPPLTSKLSLDPNASSSLAFSFSSDSAANPKFNTYIKKQAVC
jgi:hypothetical protein